MNRKNIFKIILSVSTIFVFSITVYANSGSFSSTYHITPGTASYGLLDSREFNLGTNNRLVTVEMSPTRFNTGDLTASLMRRGPLGGWSSVAGSSMTFNRTSRSVRSANGGNSGTHRLRIAATSSTLSPAVGNIWVGW